MGESAKKTGCEVCGGAVYCKGLCRLHYGRLQRYGDPRREPPAGAAGSPRPCSACGNPAKRKYGRLKLCATCAYRLDPEYREGVKDRRRKSYLTKRAAVVPPADRSPEVPPPGEGR